MKVVPVIAILGMCTVASSAQIVIKIPTPAEIGKAVEKAAQDVGKGVERAAQDVGKARGVKVPQSSLEPVRGLGENANRESKKAVDDIWPELAKGTGNLSNESGKALDGATRAADEFNKAFCSLMTAGGSDSGKASCSVSAGASVNDKGEVKGWDPRTGETHEGRAAKEFLIPDTTFDSVVAALSQKGLQLAVYQELDATDYRFWTSSQIELKI